MLSQVSCQTHTHTHITSIVAHTHIVSMSEGTGSLVQWMTLDKFELGRVSDACRQCIQRLLKRYCTSQHIERICKAL